MRAYPAPRRAGASASAAAPKPLASARFTTAGARKAVTVKLRFRGSALRKVRRARAVRLVVATSAGKKAIVVRIKGGH